MVKKLSKPVRVRVAITTTDGKALLAFTADNLSERCRERIKTPKELAELIEEVITDRVMDRDPLAELG